MPFLNPISPQLYSIPRLPLTVHKELRRLPCLLASPLSCSSTLTWPSRNSKLDVPAFPSPPRHTCAHTVCSRVCALLPEFRHRPAPGCVRPDCVSDCSRLRGVSGHSVLAHRNLISLWNSLEGASGRKQHFISRPAGNFLSRTLSLLSWNTDPIARAVGFSWTAEWLGKLCQGRH